MIADKPINDNQRFGTVVRTADGSLTLSHPGHGETYHSVMGAKSEAARLYIEASGITQAWHAGETVRVLDVGLGLGYNAISTLDSWAEATRPPDLELTSLEIDADLVAGLASGDAPWQANWTAAERAYCRSLAQESPGQWVATIAHPKGGAHATWRVFAGDASSTSWLASSCAYVWQDPFSPAKNPPLWSQAWFAKLASACAPGCVLMTYSVARAVREALAGAGWRWEKIPTVGTEKRHWLRARLEPHA